jgi:type II secretory pathway component PulM
MSLRSTLSNAFRRPAGYFAAEWNRMAPRERRLVSVLAGAVLAVLVVVVTLLTAQTLAEIKQTNEGAREALAAIAKHRDEFQEAKNRMLVQEVRIGTEQPQLAADLEAAAHETGIQIPETASRPPVPAGRRYLEHSVDVTLRQVDLLSLSKFLSKLETGRRLIVITRMNIKRSFAEGEKLNVSLTATTYEKVADTRRKPGTTPERTGVRERT